MTAAATRRDFLRLAAALAILRALRPGRALAAVPAGTVVALNGQCSAESQGRRSALKMGDGVNVGDTIDVPAGGKLKLHMSDGSMISSASGTRMMIAAYQSDVAGQRQDARVSLVQGLVRVVVAAAAHSAAFEVSTPIGVAATGSTDCFIEAQPNAAQIGVLAGSVSLTSATTRRTVTIPARWGARLEAGRDPVPARVWQPAEFEAVIARTDVN